MNISRSVVPSGGWKYKQGNFWIYGETFDDLALNLRTHRINNVMPVGNVESDIETQIIVDHPSLRVNLIRLKVHGSQPL